MGLNGEAVWQAWQRTQRLYETRAAVEARQEILKLIGSPSKGYIDGTGGLSLQFLEEIDKRDPDVGQDLVRNLDIMSKVAGHICSLKLIEQVHMGACRYAWADRIRVLGSGLDVAKVLPVHSFLPPVLSVEGPLKELPRLWVNPSLSLGEVIYSWGSVRAIHIYEANDPDLILDVLD